MFGAWQARLLVNGRETGATPFILSKVTVDSWTLNSAPPEGACPAVDSATSFTFTDSRVTAWLKVRGAAEGDRYNVTWFTPQGNNYHTQFFPAVQGQPELCLPASLPLGGNQAVSIPTGTWTVVGYWNGSVIAAQPFVLR